MVTSKCGLNELLSLSLLYVEPSNKDNNQRYCIRIFI